MRKPARVHEVGESDSHCRNADQAVQNGDKFRHLGHLHATRGDQADGATYQQRYDHVLVMLLDDTQYRCDQSDRHADDAVPVAPPGAFLIGKPTECKDE